MAHLVSVTKYRRKMLNADRLDIVEAAMHRVATAMSFSIVELNGEADHLHIVVQNQSAGLKAEVSDLKDF